MAEATITSKGQITVPKAVREALRVAAGDRLEFVINERGEVMIHPLRKDVRRLSGILKRPGQRPISVEEMNEGILESHAGKR